MQIKRNLIVVIFTAMTVLAASSCSKKTGEAGWKAEIENVNGVKTVRNPGTPRYGEFAFTLVQDLTLGDEKDEASFFPRGAQVGVDDQGTIYVVDSGNKRIQIFDRDGKFVRALGRLGQGPGEFGYPGGILFDNEDRPLVRDSRRLVAFDRDGSFLKNIPIKTFLNRLIMGPGGKVVGKAQPNPQAEGGPKNELLQLGPEGERLRTLASYPVYGLSKDQVLMHWYTGDIYFCRRPADTLYYGFSLEETIHVVDADGRPLFAFSKAEERLPITAAESELTRKEGIFAWFGSGDPEKADLGMPDHRPFFSQLLSDDEGRLYLIRFKPITDKDQATHQVDVFSKEGFYLYRMTWNFLPQAIKGGFLYEVRENEAEGLYQVIRHKILNWGDFKAE